MYCSNCGKEISNSSQYCENCGHKVHEPYAAPVESQNKEIRVIMFREKKLGASASPMHIYIDNKLVANLENGKTIEFNILYGNHTLTLELELSKTETNVNFSKEDTVIYIDVAMGKKSPKIVSIDGENNSRKDKSTNQQNSKLAYLSAIIIIIVAILFMRYLISDIQKEHDKSVHDIDDAFKSVYFNCPNCQKYISVNKKSLISSNNPYGYVCPNCRKFLTIDKNTGIVTYQFNM